MFAKKVKSAILLIGSALFLYLGSYCIISACGEYVWSQSGELRYNFGFAMTDIAIWVPKWAYAEKFRNIRGKYVPRTDPLGALYLPLILLDQTYLHKTVRFMPDVARNDFSGSEIEKGADDWSFPKEFEKAYAQAVKIRRYLLFVGIVLVICSVASTVSLLRYYILRKINRHTRH